MNLHALIEQHWHRPKPWLTLLLRPFALLFRLVAARRRARYLSGSLNSERLPVPVVVVGNIHAGGTGKTPVTAALVAALQARGIQVGIISRGYGRRLRAPHLLTAASSAQEAGDEPLMLHRRTNAPVAVAARRSEAARLLLAAHPELALLIADDGLQHYALARDLEICVFPAADVGRTDLDLLPNGGLREPVSRVADTDAVVFSNADAGTVERARHAFGLPESRPELFAARIRAGLPYRFTAPHDILEPGSLKNGTRCAAAAAIARPERFFRTLAELGFPLSATVALPDHAAVTPTDLPAADYVFVTEKDAAKLPADAPGHIWVLPVDACIEPDLADWVIRKLSLQAA